MIDEVAELLEPDPVFEAGEDYSTGGLWVRYSVNGKVWAIQEWENCIPLVIEGMRKKGWKYFMMEQWANGEMRAVFAETETGYLNGGITGVDFFESEVGVEGIVKVVLSAALAALRS